MKERELTEEDTNAPKDATVENPCNDKKSGAVTHLLIFSSKLANVHPVHCDRIKYEIVTLHLVRFEKGKHWVNVVVRAMAKSKNRRVTYVRTAEVGHARHSITPTNVGRRWLYIDITLHNLVFDNDIKDHVGVKGILGLHME
jgi:hypothetical protein